MPIKLILILYIINIYNLCITYSTNLRFYSSGLEISEPMTDNQLRELLKGDNSAQHATGSRQGWIESSKAFPGLRRAEKRFSQISSYVMKRKSSIAPSLNRFDGIRFHIKKRGGILLYLYHDNV